MKQVGEEEFVVMRGSYQYIGADGNFICSVKKLIIWSEFLNNFDTKYVSASHLAWADFKIKVKQIAQSTVNFDQWNPLILNM